MQFSSTNCWMLSSLTLYCFLAFVFQPQLWEQTDEQKLERGGKFKEEGNDLFKKGFYYRAYFKYKKVPAQTVRMKVASRASVLEGSAVRRIQSVTMIYLWGCGFGIFVYSSCNQQVALD